MTIVEIISARVASINGKRIVPISAQVFFEEDLVRIYFKNSFIFLKLHAKTAVNLSYSHSSTNMKNGVEKTNVLTSNASPFSSIAAVKNLNSKKRDQFKFAMIYVTKCFAYSRH